MQQCSYSDINTLIHIAKRKDKFAETRPYKLKHSGEFQRLIDRANIVGNGELSLGTHFLGFPDDTNTEL